MKVVYYIGCLLIGCCLMAWTPWSVDRAEAVVAQADSLWATGQAMNDSLALAQAYRTLRLWRACYPDEYVHACYHYGKLLRAQDDPAAAMQVFIHATHSRSNDYHILGRVYSNMGSICHLAEEFPLAYDMYERSGAMFLRDKDTISYYYLLNDMAYELAEQRRKDEMLVLIRQIMATCKDQDVLNKAQETQARLYLNCGQYDSTLYYARQLFSIDSTYSSATLLIAQAYSFMGIKDSATYYANIVLSRTHELFEINNALYILTNDDESRDKESIRAVAADRSDTQKLIENQKGELSKASQLLELDLNRKPDIKWIIAVLCTLIVIGGGISVYVSHKRRKHELLSQQIDDLENKNTEAIARLRQQVEERCNILAHSSALKDDLCWNDFDKMCNVINQHFGLLAGKLQQSYHLSEREIRLCVLTLLNLGYDQMAKMLFYAPNGVGKFKLRVAQKLGTTAKNLRQFLIQIIIDK